MADRTAGPPSVIALPLDRARGLLDSAGWPVVEVIETAARERPTPTEHPRVVRQLTRDDGVALTVARAAQPTWLREVGSDAA